MHMLLYGEEISSRVQKIMVAFLLTCLEVLRLLHSVSSIQGSYIFLSISCSVAKWLYWKDLKWISLCGASSQHRDG